jgi:hypothetical protein
METLLRQIRVLQACVLALFVTTVLLVINLFHPLLPTQHFKLIEANKVNIREADGTLKASLSNARGFKVFGRTDQDVTFSGLMFYNEEGKEEGGLVYEGRALPGGQRASAGLTFDQYLQDQNIYLHHDEQKDANGFSIDDGLSINARPDFTQGREEYQIYNRLDKLPEEQKEAESLKAAQAGKIMTPRVFVGVRRGLKDKTAYDDTGLFIRNRWGQRAIRLYVDNDNKPHFEIYDPEGKSKIYDLKIPAN